jgi:hypothetical protein
MEHQIPRPLTPSVPQDVMNSYSPVSCAFAIPLKSIGDTTSTPVKNILLSDIKNYPPLV